jgi:AbiJ-like protein/uncharacterized protein DUF7014
MNIYNLFSKRQKGMHGDLPDVYTYDDIPQDLRVQIIHIWNDALGSKSEYKNKSLPVQKTYRQIVEYLCREYGMFTLASFSRDESRDFRYELQAFFLTETDLERLIDVIELSFMAIDQKTRTAEYCHYNNPEKIADESIKELNERFREHTIGYKFEDGMIVRIDSDLTHSEIIKPALKILRANHFKVSRQAILNAYHHYNKGNHKKALDEALKAFKNTIKAICDNNKWPYKSKATIRQLIDICLEKELIPVLWQTQMESLSSLLENGVAICGQKSIPADAPDPVLVYVLNMTAATIVFLGESEKDL